MDKLDDKIVSMIKEVVTGMGAENIMLDTVQDLVKDEMKKYIRQKLDERPELKNEIKHAVEEYLEARIKEWAAALKLAKASAKLGLDIIPERLRAELSKEFIGMFEKELSEILKRTF